MKVENFKIKVTPEQSKVVQERLFELGLVWNIVNDKKVRCTNSPCLFIQGINKCISHAIILGYTFYEHSYPELTFEQFKEKYMEFEVPEKWCIKACEELYEYGKSRSDVSGDCINHYYWWDLKSRTINGLEQWGYCGWLPTGYTEITFEQFEKCILNKKEEMKEITGYRLKEDTPTFEKGSKFLVGFRGNSNLDHLYLDVNGSPDVFSVIYNYKTSKNFEKWFDPIYKETVPDIEISDYKADFSKKGYVKFGCMEFDLKFIEKFHQVIENVNLKEINVGDLDEIINYLQKNK